MRVELVAEDGGMEASLRFLDFDPVRCHAEFPNVSALKKAVEKIGCDPECLDDSALDRIQSLLDRAALQNDPTILEEMTSIVVVRAILAEPDQVEGLVFYVPYLSAPEDIAALKNRLLTESWETLEKGAGSDCIVEKGAKILEYLSLRPGKPGKGIRGESLVLESESAPLPEAGNSILAHPQRWMALKKGFLILEDNVLKVCGPRGVGTDPIWVTPDKMSVHLILRKEEFEDSPPTLPFLKAALAQKNLASTVPENKLNPILRDFLQENKDQDVVVLSGTPCTPGRDGYQELLVDPEPTIPNPEITGNVDFKSFTFFRSVKKGETLAKIHAPVEGRLGMDVFGKPILPPSVVPFQLQAGKNTERLGEGDMTVVAGRDGRLSIANGVPEVIETLAVNSDISLKTGNIDFPGSVEIKGDLRDNMEVKAHGDVEIQGAVEDGCITSDGAIVVRGGFVGSGKGVIKSKLSSVTIGHIRNQRIESHANILVYNEVINAFLCAKKSIIMKTVAHSVVGGHLTAFSHIEIANVGNPGGTKTILEVGKDFEVEQELAEKQAIWKSMVVDMEFLAKIHIKLQAMAKPAAHPTPDIRLLEQRTKGILPYIGKSQKALKEEIQLLEKSLYNPEDCIISVTGNAYPGTVLKYKDRTVILNEIAAGKRWIFRAQVHAAATQDQTPKPSGSQKLSPTRPLHATQRSAH